MIELVAGTVDTSAVARISTTVRRWIVIEPEVEGIESVRRVAGVVVEQTVDARAEELDLDLLRRPVVSGKLAEPRGGVAAPVRASTVTVLRP